MFGVQACVANVESATSQSLAHMIDTLRACLLKTVGTWRFGVRVIGCTTV